MCSMSTSSVSSVRFLLLATATSLLNDANARAKLYWGYKLVKVFPRSHADVEILSRLKYMGNVTAEMWQPPTRPGFSVDMTVSADNFFKLKSLLNNYGIGFKVQITDIQSLINRQNDESNRSLSWHKRYHTLKEIVIEMKRINQSTKLVNMKSIGKSFEKRDLYIMQIQANSQTNKPLVFMNCGIHAREWVSPATCMYVVDQLVSLYGKDSNVTSLLNMVDVTILPVLNADGYEYSWSTDRLWRKNRSPNRGSKCVGTDLNRNWRFKWGGLGASKDPCAADYRGPVAMSEKEVKFLNGFLNSEAKRLVGYLDVHSYSQFWMIPWGSDMSNVADYDELIRISRKIVESIKSAGFNTTYDFGAPSHLLYLCTGTLQDYVYGTLKVKYSFAIELRDKGLFGFLLPPHYIEPTAKELFEGLKTLIGEMKLDKQL